MLVDVKFNPQMIQQPSALGDVDLGKWFSPPQRKARGIYEASNLDNWFLHRVDWETESQWITLEDYKEENPLCEIGCYGVADSLEQLLAHPIVQKHIISTRADYHYCVGFYTIRKGEQPADGGWRWHKWGQYIGTQDPQMEYIFNEPEIEEVIIYHFYRLVNPDHWDMKPFYTDFDSYVSDWPEAETYRAWLIDRNPPLLIYRTSWHNGLPGGYNRLSIWPEIRYWDNYKQNEKTGRWRILIGDSDDLDLEKTVDTLGDVTAEIESIKTLAPINASELGELFGFTFP